MKQLSSRLSVSSADTQRVASFFAGIGGFDLAFEREGFATSLLCENSKFCQSVLKRHWKKVPLACDIRTLRPDQVPDADVWTAGFPCQDLSLARTPHGRHGLRGQNSGLFFKFCELIALRKPRIVLLENVAGLLNSHQGADFKVLLHTLTRLGYAVAWRVLNARYFGAAQSRPRIFICAWVDSPECAVEALFETKIAASPENERHGFLVEHRCAVSGAWVPAVSFCISATSGRHTGLDWARSYVTYDFGVRRLTPLECERLQGLPDHWSQPDSDYVIPFRGIETERYHAIGNAVCIPVAQWVAQRIYRGLARNKGAVLRGTLEQRLLAAAPDFGRPNVARGELHSVTKWKSGGCCYDGRVVQASASCAPVRPRVALMVSALEKGPVHKRYFLSPNAAQGIVRRVDRMGRKLFRPLDIQVRRLANGDYVQTEEAEQLLSLVE